MKRILVPTDFTKNSDKAVDYILDFIASTQLPARVYLLNAYFVSSSDAEQVIPLYDQLKMSSMSELELERSKFTKRYENNGLKIEIVSRLGSLVNVIPRLIDELDINLLVMGEDEGHKISEISNILKSTKNACPLLTVYHYRKSYQEIS